MTERLEIIYGHLDSCTRFADIGCDHGYITKAMLDANKCHFAVASDVSNKCLEKAKALLKDYVEDKKAECLLSDGFDNLPNFFDEALISGMGGEEIVSILKRAENLPNTLVLQPMKNAEKVREILLILGYGIVLDYTFYSGGKFYDLIKAVKGTKVKKLNKKQLKYGVDNLKLKPLAFIKKLNARIGVLLSCLEDENLSKGARKEMKKELKELKKYVKS